MDQQVIVQLHTTRMALSFMFFTLWSIAINFYMLNKILKLEQSVEEKRK